MAKKGVTPDYTRRAIQKYNAKYDRINVNLPKGTKERIKALTGLSCNKYITGLVLEDLERLEDDKTNNQEEDQEETGGFYPGLDFPLPVGFEDL